MTGGSGANAGIHADEDADEAGGEGVCQKVCDVGVFAGRSVARRRAFFLGW